MKQRIDKVQVIVYRRRPQIEILLLRRPPARGSVWGPVTGKVEPEDAGFAEAALRELEEETGILPMHALVDLDHEFRFLKQEAPVSERLMAAEVAPSARATLSAEHDQARWLPPEAALDLLSWDIHREGVRRVLDRVTGPGRSTA